MANSDGKFPPGKSGGGPSGLAKLLQDALSNEAENGVSDSEGPRKHNTLVDQPGVSIDTARAAKRTPAPGLSGFLLNALSEKSAAVAPKAKTPPSAAQPAAPAGAGIMRKRDTGRHAPVAVPMPESRGGTVSCGTCGAANPEGMYFCVHCGDSLVGRAPDSEQEIACSSCGAPNPDDNKFCGSCGYPLAAKAGESSWQSNVEAEEPDRRASPWDIRLVSINEDGTDGVEIPLNYLQTIVGRSGDTRFPTDAFLSPKHASLTIEDGVLNIEDLYSLNGTFIKLHDEVTLSPGDLFLMGRQVLRFERFEQTITPKARSSDGTRYMGSPPPGGQHKLLQIGIGGVVQNVYCIPETGAVLGREQGEIIFPRDKFMSGRHAQIYPREDGEYCLVDLSSSNGTWIKIWEKTELAHRDHIFLGQQLFRVVFS